MVENNQTKSNGRGGKRDGAGRPAGSANKRTRDIANALASDGDLTPVEYLMSVMRDINEERRVRVNAAIAAAPYMHARIASVTVANDPENPLSMGIPVIFVSADGKPA